MYRKEITPAEIDKYINYFVEFKSLVNAGDKKFIDQLKAVYGVSNNVNYVASRLDIITIKGRGKGAKYNFNFDIAPTRKCIRQLIVDIRNLVRKNNNKQSADPNEVKKYQNYFNHLKSLVESKESYVIYDLYKKHKIPRTTNSYAKQVGLISFKRKLEGKGYDYTFLYNDYNSPEATEAILTLCEIIGTEKKHQKDIKRIIEEKTKPSPLTKEEVQEIMEKHDDEYGTTTDKIDKADANLVLLKEKHREEKEGLSITIEGLKYASKQRREMYEEEKAKLLEKLKIIEEQDEGLRAQLIQAESDLRIAKEEISRLELNRVAEINTLGDKHADHVKRVIEARGKELDDLKSELSALKTHVKAQENFIETEKEHYQRNVKELAAKLLTERKKRPKVKWRNPFKFRSPIYFQSPNK